MQQIPELFGTAACQSVLDTDGTTQANNFLGPVATLHTLPARVFGPLFLEIADFIFPGCHDDVPCKK